jgi:hypothetical protein
MRGPVWPLQPCSDGAWMMADSENSIFGNLPGRKLRLDDDDNTRSRFREVLGMYVPEGPLPPRPERGSGKGGPSINQTPAPPVITSVWSASDAAAGGMTLTNGGSTVTPGGKTAWWAIRSTISKTSGKLYVEFSNSVAATTWPFSVGLANASIALSGGGAALGASNYSCGIITSTGSNVSAGFTSHYTANGPDWQPAAGTVFALAVDFTAGSIWFADNNVWTNSSNPATGALPCISFVPATVGALFAAMDFGAAGVGVWTLQSTAASQKYAPPAGFTPWG